MTQNRHLHTTLSGYIFATKACINSWKKLVKWQYLLHIMSLQYSERRPINSWDLLASLGHSSKFQGVSRFGFVTAASSLNRSHPNIALCSAVSWPGTLCIHFWQLLLPNRILPRAKFTSGPSMHHHTSLSGYIFATEAHTDNWKKTC